MDAHQRGSLALIRLIAVALISWTILELSFYVLDSRFHNHPIPIVPCILWMIPFIVGVVALVKAKDIAGWVAEKLE